MAGVIFRHCATHSCPSSTPHPSKRDNDALEKRTSTNPALAQHSAVTRGEWSASSPSPPTLCGHPQPCAPIPGTAEPYPTLWSHVQMGHHHAGPCMAQVPPSTRPLNWRTDCDQTRMLGKLPSKPLPGKYKAGTTSAGAKIHQDTIRSQALYIDTTILCKNPCSMFVSRLPLVYKRRRRTPG
jgi:hypothetical protein